MADLNRGALEEFDKLYRAPGLEQKMEGLEMKKQASAKENQLPPKTPNYGKTPKYLNKYKEEA